MFKDFIKQQTDMQWYPVTSLVTFIVFFLALSIRALMYSKKELKEMGSIPLENDTIKFDY
jgi:hypothetical protein